MKQLEIKWTISRGRDTYGYNILTLYDGDAKHRANGGGYDMLGKVFGSWLMANYKEKIIALTPSAKAIKPFESNEGYYGLFNYEGNFYLDGACGFNCMEEIAHAIGLTLKKIYSRDRSLKFILVEEVQS